MVGNASGDGERVGEAGNGLGDGVRANGDRGMCPTDLRRKSDLELLGTLPGDVDPDPLGEKPEQILTFAVM